MTADLFHQKFNAALQLGCNFAAIRMPGHSDTLFFYSGAAPVMNSVKYQSPEKPVFLCSPYGAGSKAYTLQGDAVFRNNDLISGELPNALTPRTYWFEGNSEVNFFADESFYKSYVNDIINGIRKDRFDKVVAARCEKLTMNNPADAGALFSMAVERYPHACVYFYSIDGIGTWFGATPEKLLTVDHDHLETVALAGTLSIDSTDEWTEKEYDEQGMIEFFIEDALRSNGFSKYKRSEVDTINAGMVKHLFSSFTVKTTPPVLEQKFHKLLSALNPTPAVCGLPQFEASIYIAAAEKMERRFYSGFIGTQWPDRKIHLYVNLRCAELFKDAALLYTGAGITSGSIAEHEWEETRKKAATIRSLFAV